MENKFSFFTGTILALMFIIQLGIGVYGLPELLRAGMYWETIVYFALGISGFLILVTDRKFKANLNYSKLAVYRYLVNRGSD